MISLVIKQRIILAHIDGMSNRAIENVLHLSKDTVNKYVNEYNEKREELLRIHPDMDTSEIIQACFLQVLFGQSCKIFLDIVACPNWTKLHHMVHENIIREFVANMIS